MPADLATRVIGGNLNVLICRICAAEVLLRRSHAGRLGKAWRAWNA